MSGGSQHNPNGRQSQLGSGWSPLQLQVANFLARAPQAHMASERGVTWHTPTPPPHLYHVPAPSPPDPLQGLLQLQAMKAGGNSVFRHTATPPDLYRHTPTPPDKHLLRHTPSPGDVKGGAPIPPAELYPHLGPGRVSVPDKLRGEELGGYPRTGVDLSLGPRSSNGGAALSVRDAPTINSLIARAQPRAGVARVDSLLERLAPAPASPHSVIVAARGRHSLSPHSPLAPNTPTPHSENEDSTDSCGAPTGSKRKRKPERIVRVSPAHVAPPPAHSPAPPSPRLPPAPPVENGDHHTTPHNGPNHPPLAPADPPTPPPHDPPPEPPTPAPPDQPTTRRKARSGSAETIDDIAAMIASTDKVEEPVKPPEPEPEAPVTIDKLKSVLASPGKETPKAEESIETKETPIPEEKQKETEKTEPLPETPQEAAAAPKRRSARISNSESTNVPVESPSEAKPAEPETSERSSEPTASSFVEVENQLEKMFAGLEEETPKLEDKPKTRKRRKSAPTKGESKVSRRAKRASSGEVRKGRGKPGRKRKEPVKDAYDSGSNASSGRSRGPYIQIRGPRDSPLSVSVVNAAAGDDDAETATSRRKDNFRNGLRTKGLHASTLGLRYDAMTADASWLCAFCRRGPHALGLGDLFGPYTVDTDCEEYKSLDEATRRKYESQANSSEVWFHELCAVWAPGVVACGARVWGLAPAVWTARATRCCVCARAGAGVACSAHGCRATAHYPCASSSHWRLQDDFQGRDDAVTCALRAQRFRCVPLPRPCHATVLCPLPVARSRLASRTHHSPRRRRHQ